MFQHCAHHIDREAKCPQYIGSAQLQRGFISLHTAVRHMSSDDDFDDGEICLQNFKDDVNDK